MTGSYAIRGSFACSKQATRQSSNSCKFRRTGVRCAVTRVHCYASLLKRTCAHTRMHPCTQAWDFPTSFILTRPNEMLSRGFSSGKSVQRRFSNRHTQAEAFAGCSCAPKFCFTGVFENCRATRARRHEAVLLLGSASWKSLCELEACVSGTVTQATAFLTRQEVQCLTCQ